MLTMDKGKYHKLFELIISQEPSPSLMNSCDIRKPNLTEADLDDYVNYFVQLRSQLRTSMIAGIDNEPGMKMIQN